MLGFAALSDPSTSVTVRVRGDEMSATDGPYVEAKEFLAGYYAVECETREAGDRAGRDDPGREAHRDRGTPR